MARKPDSTSGLSDITASPTSHYNYLGTQAQESSAGSSGTIPEVNPLDALGEGGHLLHFTYSISKNAILSCSPETETVLGIRLGALSLDGNIFLRHVHIDDRFRVMKLLEETLKNFTPYRATYRWVRPDTNELRILHCRGVVSEIEASILNHSYSDKHRSSRILSGIILDLTSEIGKGGRDEVSFQDPSFLLSTLPLFILEIDEDMRVSRLSRPVPTSLNFGIAGFDPSKCATGRPFFHAFAEGEARRTLEERFIEILQGKLPLYSFNSISPSAVYSISCVPLLVEGISSGIVVTAEDITAHHKLEESYQELKRNDSLRVLAAGAANNFNNSLQIILGHASSLSSQTHNPELVKQGANEIINVVKRASSLTQALLSIDTSSKRQLGSVDLNLATMSALTQIDEMFKGSARVSVVFGNPALVQAREDELIQAIGALLQNARRSMGEEGEVSIKTYQITISSGQIPDLQAGTYAKLKISYSHPATARTLSPHTAIAPEPSVIAQGFGGGIITEREGGTGTSVTLYIPIVPKTSTRLAEKIEIEEVRPLQPSPHILIVDDDIMVLETVRAVLEESGYPCITAEDASSALQLVKKYGTSIRLALVDAVMPGMDSPSLIRKLKRIKAELNIVGFSGATPHHTRPLLEAGASEILKKPLEPRKLQSLIKSILNAAPPSEVSLRS